jgi:hypothetical protein
VLLNQGFNECNKAFSFLEGEKSIETVVLTSSGDGTLFEWTGTVMLQK